MRAYRESIKEDLSLMTEALIVNQKHVVSIPDKLVGLKEPNCRAEFIYIRYIYTSNSYQKPLGKYSFKKPSGAEETTLLSLKIHLTKGNIFPKFFLLFCQFFPNFRMCEFCY